MSICLSGSRIVLSGDGIQTTIMDGGSRLYTMVMKYTDELLLVLSAWSSVAVWE